MKNLSLGLILTLVALPASAQQLCASNDLENELRALCERGTSDAIRHLAEGVPEWHWWGIPDHTTPVADSLLKARYGLRFVFHGDIVWDHEDYYTNAYNAVVRDRLAPRFGNDFVARAFADARGLFPEQEFLNPEVLRGLSAPLGACTETKRCFVGVGLDVTPMGEPTNLRIVHSSSDVLNDLALAAVSRVRLRPATDLVSGRHLYNVAVLVRFSRE